MTFQLKDISVIIPTYNRPAELEETLKHIPSTIREIIIVDQSERPKRVRAIKDIPIKIIHSSPPAITIARNRGLDYATGRIICFLDDDVTISPFYFEHILEIFNNPKAQKVEGVAGWKPFDLSLKAALIDCYYKMPFGMRQYGPARIYGPYGNSYPFKLWKSVYAEWFPGMNMCFKREVFDKKPKGKGMRFDENLLGYTIAEDIDFTYRIAKRNPRGLVITPYAPIKHRAADSNRKDLRKIAYINQVDHFYFSFKHFDSQWPLALNLIGIFLGRLLSLLSFKETAYYKYCYFLESLWYCLNHIKEIKAGKLREWQEGI